jgi:hypothetical protein
VERQKGVEFALSKAAMCFVMNKMPALEAQNKLSFMFSSAGEALGR